MIFYQKSIVLSVFVCWPRLVGKYSGLALSLSVLCCVLLFSLSPLRSCCGRGELSCWWPSTALHCTLGCQVLQPALQSCSPAVLQATAAAAAQPRSPVRRAAAAAARNCVSSGQLLLPSCRTVQLFQLSRQLTRLPIHRSILQSQAFITIQPTQCSTATQTRAF